MSPGDRCGTIIGVLRRRAPDRSVTGGAGGIGDRLEIVPVIVRLVFVGLTFAGGIGLVLYVAATLVSRHPSDALPPPPPRNTTRQALAIVLIVTGVLLLLRA